MLVESKISNEKIHGNWMVHTGFITRTSHSSANLEFKIEDIWGNDVLHIEVPFSFHVPDNNPEVTKRIKRILDVPVGGWVSTEITCHKDRCGIVVGGDRNDPSIKIYIVKDFEPQYINDKITYNLNGATVPASSLTLTDNIKVYNFGSETTKSYVIHDSYQPIIKVSCIQGVVTNKCEPAERMMGHGSSSINHKITKVARRKMSFKTDQGSEWFWNNALKIGSGLSINSPTGDFSMSLDWATDVGVKKTESKELIDESETINTDELVKTFSCPAGKPLFFVPINRCVNVDPKDCQYLNVEPRYMKLMNQIKMPSLIACRGSFTFECEDTKELAEKAACE